MFSFLLLVFGRVQHFKIQQFPFQTSKKNQTNHQHFDMGADACQTIWDMGALAMFDQNPWFAMHLENVDLLHPGRPVKSNDPEKQLWWTDVSHQSFPDSAQLPEMHLNIIQLHINNPSSQHTFTKHCKLKGTIDQIHTVNGPFLCLTSWEGSRWFKHCQNYSI